MQNNDITILEYTPQLAASVATMWNNTKEGWNGADFSTTTAKVLTDESVSAYKNLFLAVDSSTLNAAEPKVIGYCKLTKDQHDSEALYIALLSVLPEFFNRKVGKALVLTAVNKAVELGYPRLYLYTWSGNTRAVPLYKKCGFFWQKVDEIHLVNMIPSVLNCQAVSNFFQKADWYADSKRVIEIEPDGRSENKFEFYTYQWEKDGQQLTMEYCQKGKGLRKIECNDYSITATITNRDLIFGQKHQISYEIINKSGKPLTIELTGNDDKNIRFAFNKSITVADRELITAEFLVEPIAKEQGKNEIHPVVFTTIKINGQTAEFKTGIVPKYPVFVSLTKKAVFHYAGTSDTIYVNLENFCAESVVINFDLNYGKEIHFENSLISETLQPFEKKSVAVEFEIIKGCLMQKQTEICVKLQNGREICFTKNLTSYLYTRLSSDFQETDTFYGANIGKYSVNIYKKQLECGSLFLNDERDVQNINNMSPRFGKPYTSEFDSRPVEKVTAQFKNNWVIVKAEYSSQDFPGIKLSIFYKLYDDGILEKWLEFTNSRTTEIEDDLFYCDRFNIYRTNLILPYDHKIIKVQNGVDDDFDGFDSDKITENWIYSGNEKGTAGITWPKEYKMQMMGWHNGIEHNLKGMLPGAQKSTLPVTFFLDTFDLDTFRKFVAKKDKIEPIIIRKTSEVIINGGNPFYSTQLTAEVIDCKNVPVNAVLKFSPVADQDNLSVTGENEDSKVTLDIAFAQKELLTTIKSTVRYTSQQLNHMNRLFKTGTNKINLIESFEQGKKVYTVDNGVISFKSSPEFAPVVFSLVYNGQEWLDSSFPQTISKAWWTPWYGGINTIVYQVMMEEVLNEDISAEFVTLEDNFKNGWQGFKIIMKVTKKEAGKGLILEQYFVTLPGVPVLARFSTLTNQNGHYKNSGCASLPFYKIGDDITKTYWEYFNNDNDLCRFYIGKESVNIDLDYDKVYSFNNDESKDKMLFFHTKPLERMQICGNETTTPKIFCEEALLANGEKAITGTEFTIMADQNMSYKELADLRNIKFEI